jgi:hypothetical protein
MRFLQRSTHFSRTCCRPLVASFRKSLRAPFSWLEKPRNRMGRDLDCMTETDWKVDRWNPIKTSAIQSNSRPMRFLGFYNHEKGALRLAANGLQHIFEKRVERCKNGIARKRDRHRTSTKFRLGVIRWAHVLFKRFSYKRGSKLQIWEVICFLSTKAKLLFKVISYTTSKNKILLE